jgi:hypothetical protein
MGLLRLWCDDDRWTLPSCLPSIVLNDQLGSEDEVDGLHKRTLAYLKSRNHSSLTAPSCP